MPHFATIGEAVIRAKQVLKDGAAEPLDLPIHGHVHFAGTIPVKDLAVTRRLLEDFIDHFEQTARTLQSVEQKLVHMLESSGPGPQKVVQPEE